MNTMSDVQCVGGTSLAPVQREVHDLSPAQIHVDIGLVLAYVRQRT